MFEIELPTWQIRKPQYGLNEGDAEPTFPWIVQMLFSRQHLDLQVTGKSASAFPIQNERGRVARRPLYRNLKIASG
ncbi:hypothetical protein BSN85_35360 [Bradyrhizobium brasilense]|nr:hypothetical protein BSN85_35360 [Bradyrhizobium brasilense]